MTLLAVNNLTKYYGKTLAVNNISFEFESGRCVALIGPNGAGKTTTLQMLAGLLKPTEGTIQFQQDDKNNDIRSLIGYLPQFPAFYPWMTGREFLIYSGKLSKIPASEVEKRADELLERVGISEAKNRRISTYSGGMRQRLGIAQAIIHRPKLLMLDEPVSALDPLGRREVLTLMEELKNDLTILFSTHILSDADEVSDELLLLHQGEIVEAGPMDELRTKYQTTTIELSFENNLEAYVAKLEQLSSVVKTSVDKNIVHVTVDSIEEARQEILTNALEEKWPLTDFSVNRASLEDMFMKAVNG